MRVGGCVILLLIFLYLFAGYGESKDFNQPNHKFEQERTRLLESITGYLGRIQELRAQINEEGLVQQELRDKLNSATNEVEQQSKMREIERQRRKRYG